MPPRRRIDYRLPATTGRTRRRPEAEQLVMTLGMLAERPGSQLDLIAEAGVEVIGPSTVTEPEPLTTLF